MSSLYLEVGNLFKAIGVVAFGVGCIVASPGLN